MAKDTSLSDPFDLAFQRIRSVKYDILSANFIRSTRESSTLEYT